MPLADLAGGGELLGRINLAVTPLPEAQALIGRRLTKRELSRKVRPLPRRRRPGAQELVQS